MQHRARSVAVFIQDQLDSRGEVHHRDAAVEHLVAQGAHDLRAGVVLGRVHALAGGSAAVGGDHGAVGRLIELHAQVVQPLNGLGSLGNQLAKQLALGREVAAAERVEEVDGRGIVGLIRRLNAALGHHGVGVADAQLGHDHDLRAGVVGLDGRGSARAAAADDQHVHVVVGVVQDRRRRGLMRLCACEQLAQLVRHLLALVGADLRGWQTRSSL